MTPTVDGLPSFGPSKRMLGVNRDETTAPDGTFGPGTGGMSVAPDSPWNVPNHRRPQGMGRGSTGHCRDWMFVINMVALADADLGVRLDPEHPEIHAFVEPARRLAIEEYAIALGATQTKWRCEWPPASA